MLTETPWILGLEESLCYLPILALQFLLSAVQVVNISSVLVVLIATISSRLLIPASIELYVWLTVTTNKDSIWESSFRETH
jgi:hypothetical protein